MRLSSSFARILSAGVLALPTLGMFLAGCGPSDLPVFQDVTDEAGIDFQHGVAGDSSFYLPQIGGSGAAFFDYDSDGRLDIYLVNAGEPGTPEARNMLFRQMDDGTFSNRTAESGLGDAGYGMGVAIGDIDNDGLEDVYVANVGGDQLYRNLGGGRFENITMRAEIANPLWGSSAVFLDIDGDTYLDVYVANYVDPSIDARCTDTAGRADFCGPASYDGVPDVLYRNRGDGTFEDYSASSGIAAGSSKGLGVVTFDQNQDGLPDIYVANDGEANHLWINNGDGTFSDRAAVLGVALSGLGLPEAGMGIALGDLENDGDNDLFVTHFRGETNTLYQAVESGFRDITGAAGLEVSARPRTGFGTGFLDFDNDGDLDLAVVNGSVTRAPMAEVRSENFWLSYSEPNLLYENVGATRFRDASHRAPDLTGQVSNSRGLAFGDYDNDGGIDLLFSNGGGRARLLRNTARRGGWLGVRVIDPDAPGRVRGTHVRVTLPDGTRRHGWVAPGYSYESSNDTRVHFGLASYSSVDSLVVTWLDGTVQAFGQITANRTIDVIRGKDTVEGE